MIVVNLESLGIYYRGPIDEIVYLQRDAIPRAKYIAERVEEPYTCIEEVTIQRYNDTTTRRFYIGPILAKGTYGYVEYIECYETIIDKEGNKQRNHTTLVRKRSQRQHHSLFLEACLQYIAHVALEEEGFGHAISRIRDIYRLPGGSIAFTMEALRNVEKVSDVLLLAIKDAEIKTKETGTKHIIDDVLVSILAQVAMFVYCLESKLCLNHRDMKGNNILMSKYTSPDTHIKTASWSIYAPRKIFIVDFGFACIGSPPPPVMPAILSSDEFFNEDDGCPKKGRDLFQLLSFFYMVDALRESCSPRLLAIIEECLHMSVDGMSYCDYLRSQSKEKKDNIYDIISGFKFQAPSCDPIYLLNIFSATHNHIVSSNSL